MGGESPAVRPFRHASQEIVHIIDNDILHVTLAHTHIIHIHTHITNNTFDESMLVTDK